jgi:hypothetical protein
MRRQKAVVFSLVATTRDYDILDDGRPVAVVSYLKNKGGKITIGGKVYPIARSGGPSSEMLGQALVRVVTGRARAPASYTLTDADGKTLASAEHSKQGFVVIRGEGQLSFRKGSKRAAPYQLFRDGSDLPLCSTDGMTLPAEFDLPFQAFLFSLVAALQEEYVDSSPATAN